MLKSLLRLWNKKDGASAVEYGLLIAFIALGITFGAQSLGQALAATFSSANQAVASQAPDAGATPSPVATPEPVAPVGDADRGSRSNPRPRPAPVSPMS